jgi:hypothetical protein
MDKVKPGTYVRGLNLKGPQGTRYFCNVNINDILNSIITRKDVRTMMDHLIRDGHQSATLSFAIEIEHKNRAYGDGASCIFCPPYSLRDVPKPEVECEQQVGTKVVQLGPYRKEKQCKVAHRNKQSVPK